MQPTTTSSTADVAAPPVQAGSLTLILGCMFSGKTTELIRLTSQIPPHSVLAIKHSIDMRFSRDAIITHGGKAIPAAPVSCASEITRLIQDRHRAVAIDEGHFFDALLADAALEITRRGIDVLIASLEPDSWGEPFPINASLREYASHCVEISAVCARCGSAADRTQRLTPIVDGNMVVDPSHYEPRCRRCWRPPPSDAPFRTPLPRS